MSTLSGGPNIVTDGLVLYLDAANPASYVSGSTTWRDISRGGNNGTLVNGPTFNSGSGGSIVFDGGDDYVLISNNGFGTFNNQKWTVEAWIYIDILTQDEVIFSYDYTTHLQPYYSTHLRVINSGGVILAWNNGVIFKAIVSPDNTILINRWYHIVGTYESGNQRIYINGQLNTSGNSTDTITFYNQPVWVGKANYGGYLDGNMSLIKYYNRTLSAQEILQNYNSTKGRFGL
jgi:hypothetical protein